MIDTGTVVDEGVARLVDARKSESIIKLRLLDLRSRYSEGPVIAVEGDIDRVVFSHWLSRAGAVDAYEFFVCNGKRARRQLAGVLDQDASDLAEDIWIVVDRDFDELTGFPENASVFMLDRYSIENYLVEPGVLDYLLRVTFPIDGEPAARAKICELFVTDYLNLLEISCDINRAIFEARKLRLDVDSLIPKAITGFVSVELGNVTPSGKSLSDIFLMPEHDSALFNEGDYFNVLDPALRYRGKYALKFMMTWLSALGREFRVATLGLFPAASRTEASVLSPEHTIGSMATVSSLPLGIEELSVTPA